MRLFIVTSGWVNWSNDRQMLTGIYESNTEAEAILGHLRVGDEKWPGYYHMATPIAADVTGNAINFTRKLITPVSPELMAEFANIDGPWCRGQMTCDEVWKALLEAQNSALIRAYG